jgi:hypothetical protein
MIWRWLNIKCPNHADTADHIYSNKDSFRKPYFIENNKMELGRGNA